MEAALNLVNYLYYTRQLFIQYERSEDGNNPEIYEIIEPIIDSYCVYYINQFEIDTLTYNRIFKITNLNY